MRRWLAPGDALLQQAAWWWAVVLAARGEPVAAAAGGAAVALAHLAIRRGERGRVARAAAAAALYGLATDTLLASAGLVSYAEPSAVAPPWMVALWAAFGAGLTASLARAAAWRAPFLATAAALAGPLAYRAGEAVGAIDLGGGASSIAAVAAQWAVGVPVLAWVARGREARASPAAADGGGGRDRDLSRGPRADGRPRWAR